MDYDHACKVWKTFYIAQVFMTKTDFFKEGRRGEGGGIYTQLDETFTPSFQYHFFFNILLKSHSSLVTSK